MLNLLVTGASGMIGTRLLQLLPQDVHLVENIDRAKGLDILDFSGLIRALGTKKVDVLIHMAAFTDVTAAAGQEGNEQGSCFQVNVVGTKNIVQLSEKLHCRLIHISTDFVFDGKNQSSHTEEDVMCPIEWYGKTKAMAEEMVRASSTPWCIARTAYPFLASFPPKLDLVRGRLKQMQEGSLPPQFTDHTITPTFVDELARALLLLAQKKAQGIYHVVGDTSLSDFELSSLVAKTFGFDTSAIKENSLVEFNKTATRPYQQSMAMSNKKFTSEFGKVFSPLENALLMMKRQL